MGHRYTKEQREFIREIAPGRYNSEIADLFNEKFGTEISEGQIKSYKQNHKINSNVPRRRTKPQGLFTDEQVSFIKKNVKGRSNQELANLVNETFNLLINAKQMKTWKANHKLSSGLDGQFNKGHTPANKGTKGLYNVGGNKTSFKKGKKPHNYKPIGYERIDRDGYVLIKVSDIGEWHERWRHKHIVMWEKENGPIPKGHALVFLDGDKQNTALDNLQLVTRSVLVRLNQNHLTSNNPEFTKTGIVIADIYKTIGERKKMKNLRKAGEGNLERGGIIYQFCKRCNRRLKTEESKRVGYGPHCLKESLKEGQQMIIDDYGVWEKSDKGEESVAKT